MITEPGCMSCGESRREPAPERCLDQRNHPPVCPTPCDDDCEATCHEWHRVTTKRTHTAGTCQIERRAGLTWDDIWDAIYPHLHAYPSPDHSTDWNVSGYDEAADAIWELLK